MSSDGRRGDSEAPRVLPTASRWVRTASSAGVSGPQPLSGALPGGPPPPASL